ncbi:MAG: glycoside hydrolase family 125 protein, partial [Chloroflexota bacterium]|nr:glycoside hydrolase family 125 protein [Chloroflexota bacterium]
YKPLDFGNGLTTGSVNDQGRLVSINTVHPQHGYVTLTCVPAFPEDRRYDVAYVRSYRAALAARDLPDFGYTFRGMPQHPATSALETDALPRVRLTLDDGVEADLITFAPDVDGAPASGVLQVCSVMNHRDASYTLAYEWGGPLLLTRASYAQLTEGGPLPRPLDDWTVTHQEQLLTIENGSLGWAVAVAGVPEGSIILDEDAQPPTVRLQGRLRLEPGTQATLVTAYGCAPNAEEARARATMLAAQDSEQLFHTTRERYEAIAAVVGTTDLPGAAFLTSRALHYILACCAVPIGDATCLITDHQLLPLAWTRDAYYQVQALLALRRRAVAAGFSGARVVDELDQLVRRHLVWLFTVAERPAGYWGRAYLTTGRCKDLAFQLDQQCYPLLQIVDYVRASGDLAIVEQFQSHIAAVLETILERRAAEAWLFPTSETPADDVVEYPYHLSSQILTWRTFHALAELRAHVQFTTLDLAGMAEQVRQDVYRHMIATHAGRALFAYLTNLRGDYRLYHDANDLPTVLAPQWGFCAAGDPVWQATMAFAFSPDNEGGFYAGRYAGLGSVHTPHPWPLGDIQEMLVAQLLGDEQRRERVWHKLAGLACWDGLFPEAYDEHTGEVASRHWFAWPGAALAMVVLATG